MVVVVGAATPAAVSGKSGGAARVGLVSTADGDKGKGRSGEKGESVGHEHALPDAGKSMVADPGPVRPLAQGHHTCSLPIDD